MKKIGIDCRFAATKSGSGTYVRSIVSHLLKRDDPVAYKLFVRDTDEAWLRDLPFRPTVERAPYPHYSLAEQTRFSAQLKHSGIELLFSPQFNVPLRCPVPFVAAVHDLILHRFPNAASPLKHIAYRFVMRSCVKGARRLIAVSDFTARELSRVYGDDIAAKTTVVTEGADSRFSPPEASDIRRVRSEYDLPESYFLYVGNAKQHKCVQMLIDAHARVDDGSELALVCFGKEARELRLSDRARLLGDIEDADLPALYGGAKAFVTASAYEGFCLPVIEARACGCPVIAVDTSAIPEAAEGNALLVAHDEGALADGMRNVSKAPAPTAPSFSWDDAASRIAGILLP